MKLPKAAADQPVAVQLQEGKTYAYCTCGLSASQPFCDGSHQGTDFTPQLFKVDKSGETWLCQCKRTANAPFCDGSHNQPASRPDEDADDSNGTEPESIKRWHKVADLGELADGDTAVVVAGTTEIALTLRDGEYGAISNACPHQGGPLGEGKLTEDGCLQCPWHGWTFDAKTGESSFGDAVPSHPVEERDDGIYVEVDEVVEEVATVADVMARTMVNWGVTHVFGMVGHSNLGLAEALRKLEAKGKITYIGIRHEGAAAFACSGFAKASGRPAACLTIAGPGATNLLTGVWDAKVDRHPMIALTGQVNTQVLGPGAFQELDLASAFEAATIWSQTALPDSDFAELMNLAMKNAIVGHGPSHLIFPDEVQVIELPEDTPVGTPAGRLSPPEITPARESIDAAIKRITRATRPTIIAGYGAREKMDEVITLAERLGAPVLTTFKAKGQIGDDHPLAAGVLGRSGTPIAAASMAEADLLLVFGASFAAHTGIDRRIPTIQVDFDRMTLGKFHPVEVPVWGEIGVTARLLTESLPDELPSENRRPAIAKRRSEWREEKRKRAAKDRGKGLASAAVFEVLSAKVPANAVISVDVGNNTYSFGRYFESRNGQSVLMSGYLGSIGFGYPAAMGAWAACGDDRPIVAITGDGGFGQYLGELTTAVKYGMKITHILLNNSELGKISKEQRAGNWKVWQTSLHNPNFAEFASNCGALGIRVSDQGKLPGAIDQALAHDGPSVVEIITDPELV